MNIMSFDNPGGIISVEFILPNEIQMMISRNGVAYVTLKSDAKWKEIPAGKNRISIESPGSETDSGTIYETKCTIQCPFNKVTKAHIVYFILLRLSGFVLKYTLSTGQICVAGSKDYPLRGTFKRITPTKMSDFSGYQLDLSAKNIDPLLPLHS